MCLGPVRGNAARLLFHAGPKNRGGGNIYRWDYLLHLERVGKDRIALVLKLSSSYTYLRANRVELQQLNDALHAAFDAIDTL